MHSSWEPPVSPYTPTTSGFRTPSATAATAVTDGDSAWPAHRRRGRERPICVRNDGQISTGTACTGKSYTLGDVHRPHPIPRRASKLGPWPTPTAAVTMIMAFESTVSASLGRGSESSRSHDSWARYYR